MTVAPPATSLEPRDDHQEKLDRLNRLAPSKGWRAALDEAFSSDPVMVKYVTDPARWRFLDYLPLTAQSSVLEIGPGLGQITVNLAPRVGFLHAMEIEPRQAEFIRHRCRQE